MARILLIDDDNAFRTMLSRAIAHFGHRVLEAPNGKIGLEIFAQENIDVLITDIVMPEKEGLEVLMELRRHRPPVKIIAISGGSQYGFSDDYLRTAKVMGASIVLLKPFANERLMAAIDDLLAVQAPLPAMA